MGCLDDATLEAWVAGRLDAPALGRAEEHVDGCELCSRTLAALAGGRPQLSGARLASELVRAPAELAPGTKIGRHVVLSPLGRGAMGVVYLASDPELDRRVALKLIAPGARVLREAQAMARLSHPNVVAIYDVGRTDDAIYLAMEYVSGTSLRDWLDQARPSWRAVRDAFLQAGQGLVAAHEAGLVHRDFKPDNVIVGEDGRVRVTDFGLARALSEPSLRLAEPGTALVSELTRTGALIGTPVYMAPEQLAGDAADARSDQFSFAVALWEGVHGQRPFAGETIAELAAAIERGPVRASTTQAPRWLEQVLRKARSPRPADRYPTLAALLEDLVRDRRVRARQRAFGLAGLLALAVSVPLFLRSKAEADPCAGSELVLAEVWSPARAERIRSAITASGAPAADSVARRVESALEAYGRDWTEAHRSTCRATRVLGEQSEQLLDVRMQCLRPRLQTLDAVAGAFERADRQLVARADEALAELIPVSECAEASSLAQIDPPPREPERRQRLETLERELARVRAESARGRYPAALEALRKLVADARALAHRPLLAACLLELGELLRKMAQYADAERHTRESLFFAEAGRDDFTRARGWLELVAINGEQGRFARIEELGEHARAAIVRVGEPPLLSAALGHALGVAHTNLGRFDAAEKELAHALELRERHTGKMSAESARTLSALGNLARSRGKFPRALELHTRALEIDQRLLGAEHPSLARHHHNLAGVLRRLDQPGRALASYERALGLEIRGFGPRHAAVGLTHNSIGLLELDRNAARAARSRFERALEILEAAGHPDRGVALHNLGLALAAQGKHRDAVAKLQAALAVYHQTLGQRHERVAAALAARSRSEGALGERAAAEASRKQALEIAREASSSSPDAQRLVAELETKPLPPARKRLPPQKRPLGSTTYAPAQTWDPD